MGRNRLFLPLLLILQGDSWQRCLSPLQSHLCSPFSLPSPVIAEECLITPLPHSLSFALSRPFSQTHKHEQTCSHTHELTNKCAQTHMHTLPSSHFSPGLTHMLSTLTHYLSSDPVSVSDDIHFAFHSSFLSLSLALTLWNMIIIVTLIVLPIHLKRL